MCRIGMNSIPQLRYMQEQTDDYAREWYEQWNELNLDAMVCPSFPGSLTLTFSTDLIYANYFSYTTSTFISK